MAFREVFEKIAGRKGSMQRRIVSALGVIGGTLVGEKVIDKVFERFTGAKQEVVVAEIPAEEAAFEEPKEEEKTEASVEETEEQ